MEALTIYQQHCTLKQGLALVELGVKYKPLFWWLIRKSEVHAESIRYGYTSDCVAPAFNVAELLIIAVAFRDHHTITIDQLDTYAKAYTGHIKPFEYEYAAWALAALVIDLVKAKQPFVWDQIK